MKKSMQLKAKIKELASRHQVPAQSILQNFMLERLLERIAISKYQEMFILKGGLLIASMIGVGNRTTMDMDATMRNFPLTEEAIQTAFTTICETPLDDDVTLTLNSTTHIRNEDEYGGYRLSITAAYEAINTPLKIDITTGDVITPEAVRYTYPSSFGEKKIKVWAYNIETILAEKVETILRRGVLNTRLRDFYDVHILMKTRFQIINKETFSAALTATATKRMSLNAIQNQEKILLEIRADTQMKQRWDLYCRENAYAAGIKFLETINSVKNILV